MSIMRTERLVALDGTIQEERNFDGFGKLVSKRKNIKPAHSKQNLQQQEKKQMTKKFIANIPPEIEPMRCPGFNNYMELKFHQGIGHMTLSQMLQQQLNRLERDDDILSLREVYDDFFIYFSSSDNQLYRREYTVIGGRVELVDTVQKVQEEITYEPTNHQAHEGLWHRIQDKLDLLSGHTPMILQELHGNYCFYEVNNKLYRRSFAVDENNILSLSNDAVEIPQEIRTQASADVEPLSAPGFIFNQGSTTVKPMHANGFHYPVASSK